PTRRPPTSALFPYATLFRSGIILSLPNGAAGRTTRGDFDPAYRRFDAGSYPRDAIPIHVSSIAKTRLFGKNLAVGAVNKLRLALRRAERGCLDARGGPAPRGAQPNRGPQNRSFRSLLHEPRSCPLRAHGRRHPRPGDGCGRGGEFGPPGHADGHG